MAAHQRTILAEATAAIACILALAASASGLFIGGLYRDNAASVAQAQGTDLATLFSAVPLLALGLWMARNGHERARLLVLGAIGYLVYTYAIFAFQVVINPATPLHIAIVGLGVWSLIFGVPVVLDAAPGVRPSSLPRRTTAGFLGLLVFMFGGLWLGQILGAITSGALPAAITDLGLPTNAVYTLDLAFALPIFAITAVLLVRRAPVSGIAVACLVFAVLMAVSILGLFAVQAARGFAADASLMVGFAVVAGIATVLTVVGLRTGHEGAATGTPRSLPLAA